MSKSNIEWTEFTWNPVTGCTKVSQGCKFCYAETIANRFWKDRKFTDVQFHPERLDQPIKIKKPTMIFVNSMSDLFHEKIYGQDIINILSVIDDTPQHIFQVLTKRPARMKAIMDFYHKVIPNLWLGVSVEDQKTADERIPMLLESPAKVRWLSIEPLIEQVNCLQWDNNVYEKKIDWVVVGCESGPHKRECKIQWVELIVNQCKEYGIPVFVKQLQLNGKVIKEVSQFPKHLQIRQYPKGFNL